jgi:hypothetical protein
MASNSRGATCMHNISQSNFGPIQKRDKWRVLLYATPEAALRVFCYLLRDQEVEGSNPFAPTNLFIGLFIKRLNPAHD